MYDELIKNLRVAGDFVSLSGYQRDLMRKAADAIEELQHSLDIMGDANAKLRNQVPDWIPVTEQKPPLPEDEDVCYVHVIAAVKGKKEAEPVLYSRAYRLRDGKRVRIERFIGDGEVLDVTHWMPLPDPPKENGKSET